MDTTQSYDTAIYYKFIPAGLVVWKEIIYTYESKYKSQYCRNNKITAKPTYAGEITAGAKKRLRQSMFLLSKIATVRKVRNPATVYYSNFKLALQTLTLSAPQEDIPDSTIRKELLTPYLRGMKRHGMKNYVWKSELQSNGNLHFHLITDCYIPYHLMRDYWNKQQSRVGLLQQFYDKHGHYTPNSVDVRAIKKEAGAMAYLTKYMLKDKDQNKQTRLSDEYLQRHKGKVWDCSTNLKIKNTTSEFLTPQVDCILDDMERKNRAKVFTDEYFSLYLFTDKTRQKFFSPELTKGYDQYLHRVKHHIY